MHRDATGEMNCVNPVRDGEQEGHRSYLKEPELYSQAPQISASALPRDSCKALPHSVYQFLHLQVDDNHSHSQLDAVGVVSKLLSGPHVQQGV